jgi:hypothetical protein
VAATTEPEAFATVVGVDADVAVDAHVDDEGLLAALVMVPGAYARNRFYSLFRIPRYRRVRRRAAQLRGLVRHLAGRDATTVIDGRERHEDGSETIRYHVDELSLTATVMLDAFESALVDVALATMQSVPRPVDAARLVDAALAKLGPAAG